MPQGLDPALDPRPPGFGAEISPRAKRGACRRGGHEEARVSTREKAAFAFVNSGVSEKLGEHFATMAAITRVALWDAEQRQGRQRQVSFAD